MRGMIGRMAVLGWLAAGVALGGETGDVDSAGCEVTLNLLDGSRVTGVPLFTSLTVRVGFGPIQLPLSQVRTVEIQADRETASLTLVNGDKLTGFLAVETLPVKAIFGEATVGMEHVKGLSFRSRPAARARQGLVLWNRLESPEEVGQGKAGPGGTWKAGAGRFTDGKYGKALLVEDGTENPVLFPAAIIDRDAGCIELWAKLIEHPADLTDHPILVAAYKNNRSNCDMVHFAGNDGAGNGGLCGRAFCSVGSGEYGAGWTYTRVLGVGKEREWHHYALVWDRKGIAGVDNGRRVAAVFLDGQLACRRWDPGDAANSPRGPWGENDAVGIGCYLPVSVRGSSRMAIDNVKVWDYAKTDFSDRDRE